ncbi:MAG: DUF167 domain-containing protein [Methanomassiliicoccales archaeon]
MKRKTYFPAYSFYDSVDAHSILREKESGVELDIIVSPSSARSEIVGIDEWRKRLLVRVCSPPEKGQANQELVSLLSRLFSTPVEIVRGHSSRQKTVFISTSVEKAMRMVEALSTKKS